jgi:nitroreductase
VRRSESCDVGGAADLAQVTKDARAWSHGSKGVGTEAKGQKESLMETFETIRTMLAVRRYQDKPVPAATLRRVVEAGRLTGSAKNMQPWHFIVVEDRKTLQKLGALARTGAHVAQAGAAVVVAVDKTPFAVSDASRAIQSMLLAAWADGVGSNWVGFGGMEEVKALLGIPVKLDVLAILPLGYPVEPVGRGRKDRKLLETVAHRERYGQPFE